MKNVEYSKEIQQSEKLRQLAEEGTNLLNKMLGDRASLVDARWDCTDEGNGTREISLQISDWTGAAETQFEPTELEKHDLLRRRLNRLYGDLLQIRNHWQLRHFETSYLQADKSAQI